MSGWISLLSNGWLKKQCTSISNCKWVHALLLRTGLFHDNLSVSKLLSFLTLPVAGDLPYAAKLFSQIEVPDTFVWNTMIRGHARSSDPSNAVSFYRLMVGSGTAPDNYTYPFVLTACARLRSLEMGARFHGKTVKSGFESDVFVLNSLMKMYADCHRFSAAEKLFEGSPVRDVVSWNVLIGGCVGGGLYQQAFDRFEEMLRRGGIRPDEVTIINLVSCCSQLGDLERGQWLHSYSKELGLDTQNVRLGNAIVDMYSKSGDLESARQVFEDIRERDVFTWTSMISGLANAGYFWESLDMFGQMQRENVCPDEVALVAVLSSCAQMGALDQGKYVHILMGRYRVKCDVVLETALVDMYAKCGSINFALQVFAKMRERNVFSWNAMIGGLAMHGHGRRALELFHQMQDEWMVPDEVTFIGLLSACSHAGLVDEGRKHFSEMRNVYCIEPRMEHYGCMVDLLCRARLVSDALAFVEKMPVRPNAVIWASLVGTCRAHGDLELAHRVGKQMIELDPDSCGRYVALSNVYAGAHRWDDAMEVRHQMKAKRIQKIPGISWIEAHGMVQQFVAGDRSHPQTDQIYMMVEEISGRLKVTGHVSGTSVVMFDIEEEEKEHSLFLHSEKLAVAFGLMSSVSGSPIRIVKNLRVCYDCHSFMKAVSKVYGREIVARDRSRFHHFRGGLCSCSDFW